MRRLATEGRSSAMIPVEALAQPKTPRKPKGGGVTPDLGLGEAVGEVALRIVTRRATDS